MSPVTSALGVANLYYGGDIPVTGDVTGSSVSWIIGAKSYGGTTFSTINPTGSVTLTGTNLSGASQVQIYNPATSTAVQWGSVTASTSTTVTFTPSSVALSTADNYYLRVLTSAGSSVSASALLQVIGFSWAGGASTLTTTTRVNGGGVFGSGRGGLILAPNAPGYTPTFTITNGPMPVQTDICCIGAGGAGGTAYKTSSTAFGRAGGGGGGAVAVYSFAANTLNGTSTSGTMGYNAGTSTQIVWNGITVGAAGGGTGGSASPTSLSNGGTGGSGGGGAFRLVSGNYQNSTGGAVASASGTYTYGTAGQNATAASGTASGGSGGGATLSSGAGISTVSIAGGTWSLGGTYGAGGPGGATTGHTTPSSTLYGRGAGGGGCAGGTTTTVYSPSGNAQGAIFIGFPY